jgi:hypothetical protein
VVDAGHHDEITGDDRMGAVLQQQVPRSLVHEHEVERVGVMHHCRRRRTRRRVVRCVLDHQPPEQTGRQRGVDLLAERRQTRRRRAFRRGVHARHVNAMAADRRRRHLHDVDEARAAFRVYPRGQLPHEIALLIGGTARP